SGMQGNPQEVSSAARLKAQSIIRERNLDPNGFEGQWALKNAHVVLDASLGDKGGAYKTIGQIKLEVGARVAAPRGPPGPDGKPTPVRFSRTVEADAEAATGGATGYLPTLAERDEPPTNATLSDDGRRFRWSEEITVPSLAITEQSFATGSRDKVILHIDRET